MTTRPRMPRNQVATASGRMRRWQLPLLVSLLALAPLAALAHGGALELTISPNNLAAGEELTISGEGFTADAPLELHLTGPNGDAHFGDVTADDEGEFAQTIRIPGDVVPGLYLIRAAGADQEATAELTVGAMAGMAESSAENVPERDRSVAWRAIAIVLFLGLGIIGLWFALARPSPRQTLAQPSD